MGEFVNHMTRYIGEVVTVYTTSGGDSGEGFTGILLAVNNNFIRLIDRIGPAPACALGSCCRDRDRDRCREGSDRRDDGREDNQGRPSCDVRTTGAISDIPVDRIAAFVHNTL